MKRSIFIRKLSEVPKPEKKRVCELPGVALSKGQYTGFGKEVTAGFGVSDSFDVFEEEDKKDDNGKQTE